MNLTRAFRATGRRLSLPVVLLLSMFMIQPAFAAGNVQGSINGQVFSDDGAIAGATVTVENQGTGLTRSVTTDADGEYNVPALPVGSYTVTVSASGFDAVTRENVGVNVGTGTTLNVGVGGDATALQAVTVTGTGISPIDLRSTESATILGESTVDRIPVARTVTDVALLAPGTVRGDAAFGDLPSFGGSTVGENAYYINGLNVTNFRNGLGGSTVPFEFYQEFQLKTGGYSAEFGRSTGGVINAVTKSGTNEFEYGVNFIYEPWIDDLNGTAPNVYRSFHDPDGDGVPESTQRVFVNNEDDETSNWDVNVYASGPIVQDKAFFYVLYNPRSRETDNYAEAIYEDASTDDAFWGMKLDWNITDSHLLELTAFSDSREIETVQYDYDFATDTVGAIDGTGIQERGGDNMILKYTGYITPDFTLSASYGTNEYSLQDTSDVDACFIIIDNIDGDNNGCWVNTFRGTGNKDEREAYRVDADWYLGDHHLRFGIDSELNTSFSNEEYSGGGYYLYTNVTAGTPLTNGGVPPTSGQAARFRYYGNSGTFETETSAIYIEDEWQITDTVLVRLGLRNETFENKNGNGEAFIDMSDQLAPRIGLSWDALGDGTLKVFANYGRYYLPVANNTNVRLAGSETFYEEWYYLDGINADDTPVLGAEIGDRAYFSDGTVPDVRETTDSDLDPMYQDELLFGFLKSLDNGWSVGSRVIFRDLKSTLEDITINEALDARGVWDGVDHYILTNPGSDASFYFDVDGDGNLTAAEYFEVTAEELGYPESERYYNAVEFLFERAWDGVWFLQGSYTWSQSYGNNEGFVRSDNGQDDAGLTTLFDFPALLTGAYGKLPNDRTHALKLFGAYQFADHWRVGANFLMQSGRPFNAFGVSPEDAILGYGAEYFYAGGGYEYRGKRGRLPATAQLDLSLDYDTNVNGIDMNFGVDLFNVFNFTNPVEVVETIEEEATVPDYTYGLATSTQQPRYIRLRASFDF